MHDLHLPLLLLGLCFLVLLVLPEWLERFRRRNKSAPPHKTTIAEENHTTTAAEQWQQAAADEATDSSEEEPESEVVVHNQTVAPDSADDLLLLHLLAPQGTSWSIGQVVAALEAAGLLFGEMDVFHYPDPAESAVFLFSVANMNEPGTLRSTDVGMSAITGLVAFRRLSGDAQDARACACMLRAARVCAGRIGATLCDSKMQILGDSAVRELRQNFIAARSKK